MTRPLWRERFESRRASVQSKRGTHCCWGNITRYDPNTGQVLGTFDVQPDTNSFPVPVTVDNLDRIYVADFEIGQTKKAEPLTRSCLWLFDMFLICFSHYSLTYCDRPNEPPSPGPNRGHAVRLEFPGRCVSLMPPLFPTDDAGFSIDSLAA
jgi:hypothetical protein